MSDRFAALNAPNGLFQADDYKGTSYPVGFFFFFIQKQLYCPSFGSLSWRIMDPRADQRHSSLQPLHSSQQVRAAPPHPPVSKPRGNATANGR